MILNAKLHIFKWFYNTKNVYRTHNIKANNEKIVWS